jgi:hypothetical protein
MKSMRAYLIGYVILVGGLIAALWKLGVLDRVGAGWTVIGIVIVLGLGIMLSGTLGGTKTVEIDDKR